MRNSGRMVLIVFQVQLFFQATVKLGGNGRGLPWDVGKPHQGHMWGFDRENLAGELCHHQCMTVGPVIQE